jgi:hypothetical protein
MNAGESIPNAIEDLRKRVSALEGHPALSKAELVAAIQEEPNVRDEKESGPGEQG